MSAKKQKFGLAGAKKPLQVGTQLQIGTEPTLKTSKKRKVNEDLINAKKLNTKPGLRIRDTLWDFILNKGVDSNIKKLTCEMSINYIINAQQMSKEWFNYTPVILCKWHLVICITKQNLKHKSSNPSLLYQIQTCGFFVTQT